MKLPRWYARWNKRVVNKLVRRWAGWLPPFGLLIHHGRTSAQRYTVPLNVFPTADGYAVLLPYGADKTQWLKNIIAGGGGSLRYHGKTTSVINPEVTTKRHSAAAVSKPWRIVYSLAPFDEAVLLTRAA